MRTYQHAAALGLLVLAAASFAQDSAPTVLTVRIENSVQYVYDVTDQSESVEIRYCRLRFEAAPEQRPPCIRRFGLVTGLDQANDRERGRWGAGVEQGRIRRVSWQKQGRSRKLVNSGQGRRCGRAGSPRRRCDAASHLFVDLDSI
jgi:hypothetical protein